MFKHVILALAIAMTLTGCGSQFAYNNLSLISAWYLDDYVELTKAQKPLYKSRLEQLHSWHRQQELPEYRRLLIELRDHLNQDALDPVFLNQQVTAIRQRWQILLNQASPYLAELAVTLSDQQVDQLLRALNTRNKTRLDEADTPKEHRTEFVKRIEKWMGPLTQAQRQQVEAIADQHPDMTEMTVKAHRVFQTALGEQLNTRADTAFIERFTEQLQNPLATSEGRVLQEARRVRLTAHIELYKQLWLSASDQQRRQVRKRLQGYIDDIDALIK